MTERLYPDINLTVNPQNFRLSEISRYRDSLQQDLQRYEKKYLRKKKVLDALNAISIGSSSLGTLAGGSAVGTLIGGVTAPVAIPLGAIALGFGAVSTIFNFVQKERTKGLEICFEKLAVIKASLHSVNLAISKALQDETITDDEFNSIVQEYQNYQQKMHLFGSKKQSKNEDLILQIRELIARQPNRGANGVVSQPGE